MLFKEMTAVYSENHIKLILCGQHIELLTVNVSVHMVTAVLKGLKGFLLQQK
jgi:hypothetical protein